MNPQHTSEPTVSKHAPSEFVKSESFRTLSVYTRRVQDRLSHGSWKEDEDVDEVGSPRTDACHAAARLHVRYNTTIHDFTV